MNWVNFLFLGLMVVFFYNASVADEKLNSFDKRGIDINFEKFKHITNIILCVVCLLLAFINWEYYQKN